MFKKCIFLTAIAIGVNASYAIGRDFQKADTLFRSAPKVYSTEVHPHWLGDSLSFWYQNKEREGTFFYLVDAPTGRKKKAKELASLLPKKKGAASKAETHLSATTLSVSNETLSPDGQWIAFIRNQNVCIRSASDTDKAVITLSYDGTIGNAYSSTLLWSPDSKKIATTKVREVNCRRIPFIRSAPETQRQPILYWKDYPKPGDVLPIAIPALFDIETQKQIPLRTSTYENQYTLHLTGWRKNSRGFTFEFNQRGHQRYIVAEVNATDGSILHIADERSDTFLSYHRNFRYDINDGTQMLWLSERDGWRHLYLMDGNTGEVTKQITQGEWMVRSVDFVDEKRQEIYFMASGLHTGEDPYNLHCCKIKFNGTGFVDMTPENGNHHVSFSNDRSYFVDTYSRPDLPHISLLKKNNNEKSTFIAELERSDISDIEKSGFQMPEVFCAKGRDGKTDIWGTIYRPRNFDPSRSYPIIENIYAGPHSSHVGKDFDPVSKFSLPLAELGFIVVSIDGMGTDNRSKKFHDVCWKNLKDAGFPDRICWIKEAAKKYSYMDTSRVGIYGWSAGGQNAMSALLFHNDFYKAAVSICGCHDNRMDKMSWNEHWMGYPVDESYSRSSNVDNAHLLKGNLLLINGELDENVDPTSTLQVVKALIDADKDFEQLYMPGRGHSLGGKYEMHRLYDFFIRHLQETK